MSPETEPNVNPLIWAAIEQKRLLRFRTRTASASWNKRLRNSKGIIKLFGYQVGGSSSQKLPTGGGRSRPSSQIWKCSIRTSPVDVLQNRAVTRNGTSCSSESSRLIPLEFSPIPSPDAPRTLTESSRCRGESLAGNHSVAPSRETATLSQKSNLSKGKGEQVASFRNLTVQRRPECLDPAELEDSRRRSVMFSQREC